MKSKTWELGDETRTVEWGRQDGKALVRQTSEGDLTLFAFSSDRHEIEIAFVETGDYSLADLEDDLGRRGEDWQISDLADSLALWSVPYDMRAQDWHRR